MHNHLFQLKELYGLSTLPPTVPLPMADPDHDPDPDPDPEPDPDPDPATDEKEQVDENVMAAPPMIPAGTNAPAGGECLICLSERPTTLLLPCTHSLCRPCAIALRASTANARQAQAQAGRRMRSKYVCPVCRSQLRALLSLAPSQ